MKQSDSTPSAAWRCRLTAPGLLATVEALVLFLVLAAGWRAWGRCPSVPISDADTWGYLGPGLGWMSGHGFRQMDGRDWLYPAMIALFLKTTGSFAGLFAWQRALGLLTGLMMALTWRCWVSLLPPARGGRFALTLLGAAPIYGQLVNQQNLLFEMAIRPEAVLGLVVYAQLACVMGYTKFRWQTPRPRWAMVFGSLAMLFAYAALVLKPSWYLATVTTCLPIAAGMFGRSLALRVRLATPVLGAVLCFLFFWLPPKFLMVADGGAKTFLPDALFCVHAEMIEADLSLRLAAMPAADPGRAPLEKFIGVLREEIHGAKSVPKVYQLLRIDADYLMHDAKLSAAIDEYSGGGRGNFRALCFRSYASAVWRFPGWYASKVTAQFTHFLFPEPATYFTDRTNLAKEYRETVNVLGLNAVSTLSPEVREMYERYVADARLQAGTAKPLPRLATARFFKLVATKWTLPLELAFFVTLAAAHFRSSGRESILGGWGALFLFLAPLGNAFGVCIVHTLDIYRYRATYGGCLLFSLTAMAGWTALILVRAIMLRTGLDKASSAQKAIRGE